MSMVKKKKKGWGRSVLGYALLGIALFFFYAVYETYTHPYGDPDLQTAWHTTLFFLTLLGLGFAGLAYTFLKRR